jgi:beta-galactosidase
MVLFCQADVTGRTADEPAARRLAANTMAFADEWSAPEQRSAVYAGSAAGLAHLKSSGAAVEVLASSEPAAGQVLVLGPGAAEVLSAGATSVSAWIRRGGRTLALALGQEEARALLPFPVRMEVGEHISCCYAPPGPHSPLAGVGCGEFMIRDPRAVPLVTGGAEVMGNGVIALAADGNVVLCQLAPWEFDYRELYNTKGAFRHLSFAVSRLLGNMGIAFRTPLLGNMARPARPEERRWLSGLYLEEPVLHDDDPYRFFRW